MTDEGEQVTGELFHRAGALEAEGFDLFVTPEQADWAYSGLRMLTLAAGASKSMTTGSAEWALLPMQGGPCLIEVDAERFELPARISVFDAPSGFVYIPIGSDVRITATGDVELAICTAEATRRIDPYMVPADAVAVEIRGGGVGTRQINNFLSADVHDADKLICVEVITPAGGWSSYPPHKHDRFTEDEVELEEIYHFRIGGDPGGTGFFSCYTDDGAIDDTVTVRDGDTYLVPRGYHGPAAATPGHHMYYLNVMAGPSPERVWKFCDDPVHTAQRSVLDALPPDPRLPLHRR
jgi:5-deoxy-glucuronate isomerase